MACSACGRGPTTDSSPLQHVEELRQLVDRGLADEPADAGDARIVLGHELGRIGVEHVGAHRAELVDLDQLVVEAVPLLLEEHRPLAVELDGDGGGDHDRRQQDQRQQRHGLVEQPLENEVPVRDRPVGHVEHRHVADIGIGLAA